MGKFALGCVGILVILAVIVGLSFAGTYNRLVTLGQDVDKSWAEVENQYQRRADLVPNLVATVQGAASFEKDTLTAVTEARASVGRATIAPGKAPADPQEFARYEQAQMQLGATLQRLLVVAEKYPDLKANQNFRELQAQLEGTENRIANERRKFNDAAQDLNTFIRTFPKNIWAGMFGIQKRAYFESDEGAAKAPTVKFDTK